MPVERRDLFKFDTRDVSSSNPRIKEAAGRRDRPAAAVTLDALYNTMAEAQQPSQNTLSPTDRGAETKTLKPEILF